MDSTLPAFQLPLSIPSVSSTSVASIVDSSATEEDGSDTSLHVPVANAVKPANVVAKSDAKRNGRNGIGAGAIVGQGYLHADKYVKDLRQQYVAQFHAAQGSIRKKRLRINLPSSTEWHHSFRCQRDLFKFTQCPYRCSEQEPFKLFDKSNIKQFLELRFEQQKWSKTDNKAFKLWIQQQLLNVERRMHGPRDKLISTVSVLRAAVCLECFGCLYGISHGAIHKAAARSKDSDLRTAMFGEQETVDRRGHRPAQFESVNNLFNLYGQHFGEYMPHLAVRQLVAANWSCAYDQMKMVWPELMRGVSMRTFRRVRDANPLITCPQRKEMGGCATCRKLQYTMRSGSCSEAKQAAQRLFMEHTAQWIAERQKFAKHIRKAM